MGKLFMVNCNRLVSGVQYTGLSTIAGFVRHHEHQYRMFDLGIYTPVLSKHIEKDKHNFQFDSPLTYKIISNPERRPLKKKLDYMLNDLERELENFNPTLIGFSTFSDDWPLALYLIRRIHSKDPHIPIIVGGVHASVASNQIIKHPEIQAVCYGEGEYALVEILDSLDKGCLDYSVKSTYFKRPDGEIIKNERHPFLKIDERFPFLDWSDYSDLHFIYPYEGKLYRRGSVYLSRGCPFACKFCVNNFFTGIESKNVRTKNIDYAIEEISILKERYSLEMLRFWDETFLALPMKYLKEFAQSYKAEIALPFTIETTANTVTVEKAKLIADMGCQSASIGVETSDEEYRKTVLGKNISNNTYSKAFSILRDHNVRTVGNFMFLLPEQPKGDMYQNILNAQNWELDTAAPRYFFPYQGTELRDYCIENGLVNWDLLKNIEDEERVQSLDDLNNVMATFQNSVLQFTEEEKREAKSLLDNFVLLMETPIWMHKWVIRHLETANYYSNSIIGELRSVVYQKRFGTMS